MEAVLIGTEVHVVPDFDDWVAARGPSLDDPDAYVRRMVVNAHTSWWRRFRRWESPVSVVAPADVVAGPSVDFDEHRRVWLACQALPDVPRTAVVLRYYEQLEYAEIAALTGVREGSARARVSRGLAALRLALGERDE
jgi:RNA polymerase sigma factor (sigma-70 family)